MYPPPLPEAEIEALSGQIHLWLSEHLESNAAVVGVERVEDRSWFLRFEGDEKTTFGVLLVLAQRTLAYETYLMPAPEENERQLYEHLLIRNRSLYGVSVWVGDEGGIFLGGQIDVRSVAREEIDRILGSLYEYTERFFRPAMRIGYAAKFLG